MKLETEEIRQQWELERLRRPARFAKWKVSLRSIANEMLRNRGKSYQLSSHPAPEAIPTREPSPQDRLIADERREAIAALLARLNHKDQRLARRAMLGRKLSPAQLDRLKESIRALGLEKLLRTI